MFSKQEKFFNTERDEKLNLINLKVDSREKTIGEVEDSIN
jgi:hypothetical protein